jgi:hypothetical protein
VATWEIPAQNGGLKLEIRRTKLWNFPASHVFYMVNIEKDVENH